MFIMPPYSAKLSENELTIITIPPDALDLKKRSLGVRTTLCFDQFFSHLQHSGARDYHHLVSLLHPYTDKEGNLRRDFIANYAHMRKAGKGFFEPVSVNHPFLIIDKTKVKQIQVKDSGALLLYSKKTPELTLKNTKSSKPPAILSMIPGPTWHQIPILNAPDYRFIELFYAFLDLGDLKTPKTFWIKKLVCNGADLPIKAADEAILTDVVIVRNVHTYENIKHHTTTGAYFTAKGVCHYVPFQNKAEIQSCKVSFKNVLEELSLLMPDIPAIATIT